jgi:ribonucleoside-diphosphate reductase alpha chain
MGFTDICERLGISYESEEAYELIDSITEHISYSAIDESANLARERGSYDHFEGSRWSQGLVPFDSIDIAEKDRGVAIDISRKTRLDWDALRVKVKGGIRNATLMAIAPTASIGLVAGTTPGLDPQFSQIFSRSTSSGKFLEVNRNLVDALKERGLWESVREDLLRSQGDVQSLPAIPDDLKEVYKTSFQLSPYAFLEVAGRAQKWIDQAISRNMYLETREIDDLVNIYVGAWERGVKTTYYLHMKPRHTAEQSTVKVNKAESIVEGNKKGFGSGAPAPAAEPVTAAAPRKGFGFGGA